MLQSGPTDVRVVNPVGLVVPEPTSLALGLLGGAALAVIAWRSRRGRRAA